MVLSVNVEERSLDDVPASALPFLDYWHEITAKGRIGPAWRDFNMLKIPTTYIPSAVVVDYNAEEHTYRYRYWGSALTGVFGGDYTGKTFEDLTGPFRYISYQTYDIILHSKCPVLIHFNINNNGIETSFQDVIRVPLSDNGDDISGVVSIIVQTYQKHEMDHLVESQMLEILSDK